MNVFRIPGTVAAIIFDLDNTLYTNSDYIASQHESPVRRLAETRGCSFDEMDAEIRAFRKSWTAARGETISLANTLAAFGISLEETIRWREELCHPEQFLSADRELVRTLEALSARSALGIYTNNPVSVARETLSVLGAESFFPVIVGLDTCAVSKPAREPLLRAAALLGAEPETCVSVGDRYDLDIALPLSLGMGGILVDGAADVYRLPFVLDGAP